LFVLHASVITGHAAGPEGQSAAPTKSSSSTKKRVIWTVIGAGAGFAAGVYLGLNAFDDAVDSDRKVWTTAILGAAGGGLAANLLSRTVGRNSTRGNVTRQLDVPIVPWSAAVLSGTSTDASLRSRVRAVEAR
jgi:hypothetical protein